MIVSRFPCSSMILPHHRLDLALQKERKRRAELKKLPYHDEQRLQEFQSLLEQSLNFGLVIRMVTASETGRMTTTGIVQKINPQLCQIVVKTLEGSRIIFTGKICDIAEA